MILLDTNVVSEAMRPSGKRDQTVAAWFTKNGHKGLYISTITEAELWSGFHKLPDGEKRAALGHAITVMLEQKFTERVIAFDSASAKAFGKINGDRQRLGRPILTADAQIAAIAYSRGFKLATRNTHDFEHCNIALINPWGNGI
jgi:predicted nucleic acid-binding protein